jgi:pyruvate/2-oxoglutarate dehydrogenase complex dihydrolipoamide dehydrogenase (E3) component
MGSLKGLSNLTPGIVISDATLDYSEVIAYKESVINKLEQGILKQLKSLGVHLVFGKASLGDQCVMVQTDDHQEAYKPDIIIIATGSVPKQLKLTGDAVKQMLTSKEILAMKNIPESLTIIGAGVIGMEFAFIFNALAILALNQFRKLEKFNEHRKIISNFYEKNLKELNQFNLIFETRGKEREVVFMKYPILTKNSDYIVKEARNKNIMLNDGWRKSPIVPSDTKKEKMGYVEMSCPEAEKIAENILNLPTHIHISIQNAQKIVNFLKNLK